jgi:hypothetical protein
MLDLQTEKKTPRLSTEPSKASLARPVGLDKYHALLRSGYFGTSYSS